MPTPDNSILLPSTPRTHPSCPPETGAADAHIINNVSSTTTESDHVVIDEPFRNESILSSKLRFDGNEEDVTAIDSGQSRSTTTEPETRPDEQYSYPMHTDLGYALRSDGACTFSDLSILRKRPSYPSSFFRPGSRFVGTQTDKQVYKVEVQIKQVDMRQSTMCGYLKIDGLTQDYPSLTTFFEGEIIGPHYSFITKHPDWGASEKTDLAHWDRFPAFRPLAKQAKNPDFHPKNVSQKENIFMRWKERFLVPDHKISEIQGASYEGFYYICFNQIEGTIAGIYFHAKSDRYQSLDLKHVPDHGRLAAFEWA